MAKDLTIPQRLEWLLKKRGVSQNGLARVAKVSPQTVANTLRHGRLPQSKTTAKFARTLGVPASVFTAKSLTEDQLNKIVASSGTFKFAEGTKTASKPAARKTTTARKPVAKKAAAKKPVAKKAVAKKPVAKKAVAKKPVAKKAVAKKPATRTTAARKATTTRTAAKKPVAKKAVAKKPVARKAVAKKPTTAKRIVRHGATAAKRTTTTGRSRTAASGRSTSAARKTSSTAARKPALRGGASSNGRLGTGVDYNAIVTKLQKLANSKSETVALGACQALLTLR